MTEIDEEVRYHKGCAYLRENTPPNMQPFEDAYWVKVVAEANRIIGYQGLILTLHKGAYPTIEHVHPSKRPRETDKTIPLRQIDELARELYSKEYDLASWWCESIAFRESWRDKAQAMLEDKHD